MGEGSSYRELGVGLGEELRVGGRGGEIAEKSQRPAVKPDSTKSRLSKLSPPRLNLPIR